MASAASVDFLSHLLGPNRQYPVSDNASFLEYAYLALQAKSTKGSFTRKTNSIDFAYLSTLQQIGAGMTLTQAFQTVFIDPEYDSYSEAQTENANLKDWSKSTRRPANFLVCDNVDVERKIKERPSPKGRDGKSNMAKACVNVQ